MNDSLLKRLLVRIRSRGTPPLIVLEADLAAYQERIAVEQSVFAERFKVHDLPAIFHYWSNKHLRPRLESFGFTNSDEFFARYLKRATNGRRQPARFASLGSGNCDLEVRLACALKQAGVENFLIECIDINTTMLERGNALAREHGVSDMIIPTIDDFNSWKPSHRYTAVFANHSLHHVLQLEQLFGAIRDALDADGLFLAADMIGRNGHQRWPEALDIVREFWRELPTGYRYNQQLQRQEDEFRDWDCSGKSFEGIRAQDILPLLVDFFHFELFIGFGNVIFPFVDRSFGHHFDAQADWDRDFIDRVHARDDAEILAGRIKPTQMFAVMCKQSVSQTACLQHLTPEFCVRTPP